MGSIRLSDSGNTHLLEAIEGWRVMGVIRAHGLRFTAVSGGACASPPAMSTSRRSGRSASIPGAPTKPPCSTGSPDPQPTWRPFCQIIGRRSSMASNPA